MDTAYNLETQKLVKAWVVGKDTSYIKPEEDIFLANKDEVPNHDEICKKNGLKYCEVKYKKGHDRQYKNGNITAVRPHFFILNKSKYGFETLPESPEHKKIKSFLYDYFFTNPDKEIVYSKYSRKNETITNSIKIKDLNIEWDLFRIRKEDIFEVNITDTFNTRRVDLFLKFKSFNPLFGEGLVIEVQLSPQNEEITKKRTIERALKGYSCMWINKNNFIDVKEDYLELNDKEIIINSFQSVLHNNSDYLADEIYTKIKRYSREFDLKCENTFSKLQKQVYLSQGMLCPLCKSGQLLQRKSLKGFFLGCSNFSNLTIKCKANYIIVNPITLEVEE